MCADRGGVHDHFGTPPDERHLAQGTLKDQSLEVAPMIGRPHRYKFNELQSVTCRLNAAEFLLRFDGGRPVKLSVMMNGTRELLEDLGNPMVDYED